MNVPEDFRAFADTVQLMLPDDVSPALLFAVEPATTMEVLRVVARFYGTDTDTLRNRDIRTRHIAFIRQVACYLARSITGCSHRQLSDKLYYAEHTTVAYSCAKIGLAILSNEILRDDIDVMRLRVVETVLARCGSATCH